MNKKYENLKLQIVLFSQMDMIRTSEEGGADSDFTPGENQLPIVGGGIFS